MSATLLSGNTYSGWFDCQCHNSTVVPDPAASTIKNKTAVINWKEASLTGSKTYCVTFEQTFKGAAPYKATGPWSVVGTKDNVKVKSEYTAPVTFTP